LIAKEIGNSKTIEEMAKMKKNEIISSIDKAIEILAL
jgi:hypothetical protein